MGLLTTGEPLDWFETKKHSDVARSKGIEQFIKLYKTFKKNYILNILLYSTNLRFISSSVYYFINFLLYREL